MKWALFSFPVYRFHKLYVFFSSVFAWVDLKVFAGIERRACVTLGPRGGLGAGLSSLWCRPIKSMGLGLGLVGQRWGMQKQLLPGKSSGSKRSHDLIRLYEECENCFDYSRWQRCVFLAYMTTNIKSNFKKKGHSFLSWLTVLKTSPLIVKHQNGLCAFLKELRSKKFQNWRRERCACVLLSPGQKRQVCLYVGRLHQSGRSQSNRKYSSKTKKV